MPESVAEPPNMAAVTGMIWQRLLDLVLVQRDRWALFVPVPLAGGILAWFALARQPDWWLAGFFLVTTFCIWRVLSVSDGWRMPAIVLVWTALGFAAADWRGHMVAAPLLDASMRYATLEAKVDSVHPRGKGYQVILSDIIIAGLPPERNPGRLRLTVRGKGLSWKPGNRVRLKARLFPPSRPVMPGAWDYGRQLWFDGINGTGFSFGQGDMINTGGPDNIPDHIAWWRQQISQSIIHAFQQAGKDPAVALALVTGERGLLAKRDKDAMRDAGLAHLLAISGLHIGLVSGMGYVLVRLVFAMIPAIVLRWPVHKWAAVTGWGMALVYWQMAGATIPTERAFIMMSVFFLAILLDRQALSIRNVMIAAVLVMVCRPEAVTSAGFHLSFAATAALVAMAEIWQAWRQRRRHRRVNRGNRIWRGLKRLGGYPVAVMATSLVAGLATAPLAAWHFGQVAHYGLLGNLLVIPLVAFLVMPLAVLVVLTLPFGLSWLPVQGMAWALDLVLLFAGRVAALPGAVGLVPAVSSLAMVMYGLALVLLVGLRGRARLVSLPVLLLAIVFALFDRPVMPSIVIGEDGNLVFLPDPVPVWWARGKVDDWTLSRWGQAYGIRVDDMQMMGQGHNRDHAGSDAGSHSLPGQWANATIPVEAGIWHCDKKGCSGKVAGYTIAIAGHVSALSTDCRKADILVATMPVRQDCPRPLIVIDRFDLWHRGSHSIAFNPGPVVNSAVTPGYTRPWHPVKRRQGRQD